MHAALCLQFKDRLLYAKLLINGTESDIDPCATYTVVTSDYLASECGYHSRPGSPR